MQRKEAAKTAVVVDMQKVVPVKELPGMAKFKKSTQESKDELRKGWN